jgi:hypothetical protein
MRGRTEEDLADAAEGSFEVVDCFIAEVQTWIPFIECVCD